MKAKVCRSAIEKWNKSLELQYELRISSLQLDRRSSRAALGALARKNAWRAALALRDGIERDILSVNACIRGCDGQWETALWYLADALHVGIQIDVIACTTALGVCGWPWVLELLDEVEARGLELDMISYGRAVSALQKQSRWAGSLDILHEFMCGGREMSLILCNAAISSCEMGGKWQLALDLLYRRRADIISYNAAISSCEKASQWQWAMHLFEQVPRRSLQRDLITFSAAISAFEKSNRWQEALTLYSRMLVEGLRMDVVACNAMMSACEKAGQWEQAHLVMLDLMAMRLKATATTKNALLSSFQKGNEWQRAVSLLIDLKPEVDLISYNAVIAACIDHWLLATQLFADLQKHLEPDLVTYTSLVSACGRGLQWQTALSLAHSSPQSDAILYISTLTTCSKATQWQAALMEFQDLRRRRWDVDADAYDPLLQAAFHADAMSAYLSELEWQALDLLPRKAFRTSPNCYLFTIASVEPTASLLKSPKSLPPLTAWNNTSV